MMIIFLGLVKVGTSNFVCGLIQRSIIECMVDYPKGDIFRSHDLFEFLEISYNISETVQGRDL